MPANPAAQTHPSELPRRLSLANGVGTGQNAQSAYHRLSYIAQARGKPRVRAAILDHPVLNQRPSDGSHTDAVIQIPPQTFCHQYGILQ